MDPSLKASIARLRSRHGVLMLVVASASLVAVRFFAFDFGHINFSAPVNLPVAALNTRLKQQRPIDSRAVLGKTSVAEVSGCNIENINGVNFDAIKSVDKNHGMALDGWAVDLRKRNAAAIAWIELVGAGKLGDYVAPIRFRTRRSDVQETLRGRRGYAMAGFMSMIDVSTLPSGPYHLMVLYKSDSSYYRCDNGRNIVLKDSDASRLP